MQTNSSAIERPVLKLSKSVLNTLNNAFTFSKEHRHIDDEKFQVPLEVSKKRITNILLTLSLLLNLLAFLLTMIISVTFKGPNYQEISKVKGE